MLPLYTFATLLFTLMATAQPLPHVSRPDVILTAASYEQKILGNSRIGCRNADVLADAASQADAEKFLMGKLKAGDCKLLPAGTVQIEMTSPVGESPAQSCVRPKGSSECWWVLEEFLK